MTIDKQELLNKAYEILGEPITEKQFDELFNAIFEYDYSEIKKVKIEVTTFFADKQCKLKTDENIQEDEIEVHVSPRNINKLYESLRHYQSGNVNNNN